MISVQVRINQVVRSWCVNWLNTYGYIEKQSSICNSHAYLCGYVRFSLFTKTHDGERQLPAPRIACATLCADTPTRSVYVCIWTYRFKHVCGMEWMPTSQGALRGESRVVHHPQAHWRLLARVELLVFLGNIWCRQTHSQHQHERRATYDLVAMHMLSVSCRSEGSKVNSIERMTCRVSEDLCRYICAYIHIFIYKFLNAYIYVYT